MKHLKYSIFKNVCTHAWCATFIARTFTFKVNMRSCILLVLICLCIIQAKKLHKHSHSINVDPSKVFSKQQIRDCYEESTHDGLRQPSIARIKGTFILFAECRNAPKSLPSNNVSFSTLDDFTSTRMVFTTSNDGLNWSPVEYILPVGYSKPKVIYDEIADIMVLQYNYFGDSSSPRANHGVFQITSKDLGKSWSQPLNISQFLAKCDVNDRNRVRLSAGNHVQTPSGRLVFGGMNNDQICIWFSDDHGRTYKVAQMVPGSENSIAAVDDNHLFMTTRGGKLNWNGYRAAYFSEDAGQTWGTAVKMPFPDATHSGCSASVFTMRLKRGDKKHLVMFYTGPTEKKRTTLGIHCSWDGGKTWPSQILVNPGDVAAYSVMSEVEENGVQKLLVVWEQKPNMLAYKFDLDWCKKVV